MGQALVCYECAWSSQCYSNLGVSISLFCCNCWMCMPEEIAHMRGNELLKIGCNQGYGSTFFCCGQMICVPEWLALYSIRQSIGDHRGRIYDVDVQSAPLQPQGYGGQPQAYGGQPQGYGGPGYGRPY